MWSCEHKGPDHLVYIIIMKKVQIYSKKKVEEFKFVLKIFKYMCLDQKYIYLYHMNSPKMATQVKFHNWTLQERNYFYFPRNFIFSRLLKKECNNWAGGCLGEGRHLCTWPEFVSNPPKSVEWDKKIGTFQTCEKSSKTCLFSHNWSIVGIAH